VDRAVERIGNFGFQGTSVRGGRVMLFDRAGSKTKGKGHNPNKKEEQALKRPGEKAMGKEDNHFP